VELSAAAAFESGVGVSDPDDSVELVGGGEEEVSFDDGGDVEVLLDEVEVELVLSGAPGSPASSA
jgi:hypothetical protein